MVDPVSALNGRVTQGAVTVRDCGVQGMITLRADLGAARVKALCKAIAGQAIPDNGRIVLDGATGLAWMSPDEVLLMVPYPDVAATLGKIDKALTGLHYLAVDVSDARALIAVEGAFAAEVMAKLAPVDLHPDSFAVGQMRRSRMGQVAAAFWRTDAGFQVICFRSVAEYMFNQLSIAAKAGPVGVFAAR